MQPSIQNSADKIQSLIISNFPEWIRDKGKKLWLYIVWYGPLAPYLKKIVGEVFHQKMGMSVQLGYWPQIREPRTFNEKIMNRKIFTNNQIFSEISDKWACRDYVTRKIGTDILNEVYHVTEDPSTIPFGSLPDSYVVKPTHTSGEVILVKEKEEPDEQEIIDKCFDWLSQEEYGLVQGEYWYAPIDPKVIVEKLITNDEGEVPNDFKFFVFHGEVKYIQVDMGRFSDHTRRFYNQNWEPKDFKLNYPIGPEIPQPELLDEMIDVAEDLGEGFDFVRVDLYQPNGEEIIFGELTLAPGSGGEPFDPREWDFELGSYW